MNNIICTILIGFVMLSFAACSQIPEDSIDTEQELISVKESLKVGEIKTNMIFVGTLDLNILPMKRKAQMFNIGNASTAIAGYDLDKDKYHGKSVLIKADICHGPMSDEDQKGGHWIVNIRHIEIRK